MKIGFVALSMGLLSCSAAFAGNIVSNPGFETGDYTGWTEPSGWFVTTNSDTVFPNSGMFYSDTGCVGAACITGPGAATFFQTLTTVAGQTYTFSFFYDLGQTIGEGGGDSGIPDDPNDDFAELVAQWNGTTVLDVSATELPDAGYVLFSVDEMATSTSSTIQFFGRQDPAEAGIDDVCVDVSGGSCPVAASGVPEPGSMLLMSGGMFALALLAYLRRRSNKAHNLTTV